MIAPLLPTDVPHNILAEVALTELLGGRVGWQITTMTIAGKSTREIGAVLGVSAMTVSKRSRVNAERLERVARLAGRIQAIERKASNSNGLRVLSG